jgi:hypothetical protein
MVAVISVFEGAALASLKVAVSPMPVTVPASGPDGEESLKDAVVNDVGDICSLNVAVTSWVVGVDVALFKGDVAVTVGPPTVGKLLCPLPPHPVKISAAAINSE